MLAVFAPLERGSATAAASMPWTWSSPTRMPPGSASCRGRPPRSSEPSSLAATAGSRPTRFRFRRRFTAGPSPRAENALQRGPRLDRLRGLDDSVFANATAEPYPDDAEPARALLASQLARPVEFVAQIEAMYRMGARTFLEVGPDAKLTGLVRAILEGRDHLALAVDASRGASGNLYDLACSLATLASLGMLSILLGGMKGPRAGHRRQKSGAHREDLRRQRQTEGARQRRTARRAETGRPGAEAAVSTTTASHSRRGFRWPGTQERRCLRITSREITPRLIGP